MNTPRLTIRRLSRLTLLLSGLALIAYLLYFHRLGDLLPGFSQTELHWFRAASDWHFLVQNPVNIFFTAPLWLMTAVYHHGLLTARILSAAFGIAIVLLFFTVVKLRLNYWHALLGTLLFATSAGFLHTARLGAPQILQMSILGLIAAIIWYMGRTTHRYAAGYLVAIVAAMLCYIPGLIWLELLALALLWSGFRHTLMTAPRKHLAGWVGVFTVVVAPLLVASALRPHVAMQVLGFPNAWPNLVTYAHNVLETILSIGVRSSGSADIWVGHAPLLNVIEIVLVCIALYERLLLQRSFRSLYAICCTVIGILLIALGGPVGYAILVPFLYLFVIEGLSQLLKQWFAVFPRNPFAKGFGIVLVLVMLSFSISYHVRAYFVAWPHNEQTQQAFSHTRP
jgi:hypothetical protein